MGITVSASRGWNKTTTYLKNMKGQDIFENLERFGKLGVTALSQATPVDHGVTANSWEYEIVERPGYYSIRWYNTHVSGDQTIAILLQYGHGTRTGGYVYGRDYIMPAIRPIFDQIDAEVRKVVSG